MIRGISQVLALCACMSGCSLVINTEDYEFPEDQAMGDGDPARDTDVGGDADGNSDVAPPADGDRAADEFTRF